MQQFRVFDVEANGLVPSKLHCMSYTKGDSIITIHNDTDQVKALQSSEYVIGHNIIRWDIPAVERLLDFKLTTKPIDTLALSWYLYPKMNQHGLETWGEFFGIPKPPVVDWENEPVEVYNHRCEQDVTINKLLWDKMWKYLLKLYGDEEKALKLCEYLTFKMQCARDQEESRWLLDQERCTATLAKLDDEIEKKVSALASAMPKVEIWGGKSRPKKAFKQDGTVSALGKKWFDFLEEQGLPENTRQTIPVLKGYKDPNPGSSQQVKDWLYSYGWVPETFKYVREGKDTRKIPQVNLPKSKGICGSIKDLYPKEPKLELLEGLGVLNHRASILRGFLANVDEGGYVQALVQGLTNTLRFKHKVLVNMPKPKVAWGKEIRGCLIAPEGYELCGSDMSSLEDRTKQHYIWDYDPEYVKEMQSDDFDPHLDLCEMANILTADQVIEHKTDVKEYGAERDIGKEANYSALYGVQSLTLSRTTGASQRDSQAVLDAFWARNWAVTAVAAAQTLRTVNGQKWLYNPVSKFWYCLRAEKDIFSTLNQGTGVYCFDTWVKHIKRRRKQMTGQYHDEIIACLKVGFRDRYTKVLLDAMDDTNEELQLNRELACDIAFGDNYAEVH